MSRHVFDSGDQRWTVGWDVGLSTFYAQVEQRPSPATAARTEPFGEDSLRDVVGVRSGELASMSALRAALAPHVELPAALVERLTREHHGAAGPVASTVSAMGSVEDLAALQALVAAAFPAAPQAAVTRTSSTTRATALPVWTRDLGTAAEGQER